MACSWHRECDCPPELTQQEMDEALESEIKRLEAERDALKAESAQADRLYESIVVQPLRGHLAKMESENADLTAQVAALRRALKPYADEDTVLTFWSTPRPASVSQWATLDGFMKPARKALDLTPAEALDRSAREAEEKRLMEAVCADARNVTSKIRHDVLIGLHVIDDVALATALALSIGALDNFRKGMANAE